jgi:hypothetical protein
MPPKPSRDSGEGPPSRGFGEVSPEFARIVRTAADTGAGRRQLFVSTQRQVDPIKAEPHSGEGTGAGVGHRAFKK